ncbi:unnamed protein product, partial [marine sediment metagenome]
VKLRTHLGKSLHLSEQGKIKPQFRRDLFHGAGLGVSAYPADADPNIDSGSYAAQEKVPLQIDLAVGYGNDIRGDISRDLSFEGLDDR